MAPWLKSQRIVSLLNEIESRCFLFVSPAQSIPSSIMMKQQGDELHQSEGERWPVW